MQRWQANIVMNYIIVTSTLLANVIHKMFLDSAMSHSFPLFLPCVMSSFSNSLPTSGPHSN